MSNYTNRLIKNAYLDLGTLRALQDKPDPFTPGEPLFWDDPHISTQMLAAHLDPMTDLASRKAETIEKSVAWIVDGLNLQTGDVVLDLGCGPGLYAQRLASRGMIVTGIDYSRRSIETARQVACEQDLSITYHYQDYLTLDLECRYDAVLLIFGDYCTYAPEQRRQLLRIVRKALNPGGYFVLDVSTRLHRERHGLRNGWYAADQGFWRPGPHLVLEQGFDYQEKMIWLDQYIVIEKDGKLAVYRNWFQDYHQEKITKELTDGGLIVRGIWGDLVGKSFSKDTEWIGIVSQKTLS